MGKFSQVNFKTYILSLFLGWRVVLFLTALIASLVLSFHLSFPYVNSELIPTGLPDWVWGFGNFDGVHYLRIARGFYSADFSQAFFPLYPLLVRYLTLDNLYFIVGFLISNLAFVGFLFMFYQLIMLDFSEKIARQTILFLILFPTAFYFGAVYSESLFLFLVILSLYFIRKEKFLIGSLFAAFASATRVFGFLLVIVLLFEVLLKLKRNKFSFKGLSFFEDFVALLIAPLGGIIYMVFLKIKFADALLFLDSQPHFGASRSVEIVLLPQVFYRYLKILLTVPFHNYAFFTASLELIFTLFFVILLIVTFKKIRFSYWLFSLCSFILPTLTGTFSSMPRYTLMSFLLFPALVEFFDQPKKVSKRKKYLIPKSFRKFAKLGIMIILAMSQIVLTALFVRGYWVA